MNLTGKIENKNYECLKAVVDSSHLSKRSLLYKSVLNEIDYNWKLFDNALFCLSGFEDLSIYSKEKLTESDYIETYFNFGAYRKRIVPHKLSQLIQDGASVVLNKMQNKCSIISDICQMFSKYTGCLTNANSYAARGGCGTFNMHWDSHDVYAVQLIGKKRWKIYPPTFIDPLPHQKSKNYPERPTEPCLDIILEAGDILYIPRGWWHDAIPLDNQDTFHIAIGVFPNTVLDFLSWVLANKMADHVSVRDYIEGSEQKSLLHSLSIFSEISSSELVFRQFCEEHTKHIRYKTRINTTAFFVDDVEMNNLKFNGVFRSQFNDAYIVNGVTFETGPDFQEVFRENVENHNPTQPVDKTLIKNLISFGIIS
ncbi:hypothetical protein EOE67_13715 [Rheinheimera riviphila]|uniref:JmjC domain-containing protein n=1 Tax=Rheinheimera riviphila TaxID=1834037 RepID=A0A437QLU7_9GAMM|nr:cupin domain-containing protein [Rheinheimera riviphila]RVU35429.1 hypothetical protein EOE67_13715 [Rheinheimera riviphila]